MESADPRLISPVGFSPRTQVGRRVFFKGDSKQFVRGISV